MKYILKTSKLSLNPQDNQNKSIIYTGSPNKGQKDKGKLIVMFDFPEQTENPKDLGNLLVQKIHKLYYESTLIDQESILENILGETNENLPTLTKINKDWLKKFNALITIIYRQDVYFSPVGNISAWVNSPQGKIVNIFDYVNSEVQKPTIDNVFTNILSGKIESGQSLIFTTNSVFDYIAEDKLDTIMKENDPQGIVIKLKELLFEVRDKSFCLSAIKLSPYEAGEKQEQIKSKIQVTESAQESIDNLLNIQQKTKEILTKGKTKLEEDKNIKKSTDKKNNKKQKLSKDTTKEKKEELNITEENEEKEPITKDKPSADELEQKIMEELNITEENEEKEPITEDQSVEDSLEQKLIEEISANENETSITAPSRFEKKYKKQNSQILKKILRVIIFPFIKIIELLSKIKIPKKEKNIGTTISQRQNAPITVFRSSKNKNKIILIIATLLLLGFILNLILTNNKKEQSLDNEKYEKILAEIKDKKMEYDLANIYKDEAQAKEKLKEISELINSLPQQTKKQQEEYAKILGSITEILNSVRKMETITNPEIFSETNFDIVKIIKHGNQIINLGSNSSQISKIDINSKSQTNIGKDGSYTNINTFTKNGDYVIGLDIKDLVKINPANSEITKESIAYHPNYKSSADAETYADNLYILDSQSNQIYKHIGNKGKLGKGDLWIKDNTNVSNSTCIAIDTNIYIGNNDGSLIKMYAGKKTPLELKDIDPKISKIDKIYTDKSIKEIYILDSSSKRIIIIDKDGNLLKQYYLPTLKQINNFAVDGASKKLYIASENKIIILNISL